MKAAKSETYKKQIKKCVATFYSMPQNYSKFAL